MRVAMYYNNRDVRLEEIPTPMIGSGELLVKVLASGICGSDVIEWYRIKKAPRVLGHTKGVLVSLSGSSALLADTIHAFSDVLASILVIIGIWLSGKKAMAFPWGLYKIENFVALVSAGFIFFAGYEILSRAFVSEETSVLAHLSISMLSLLVMIVIIIFFSRYEAKRAKVLNSPSLRADATH